MSFTAVYTPLYALDHPPKQMSWRPTAVGSGVKITDPEGLDEHLPDWDTEMVTDEWTETDEYPGQTWEILKGYQTWDKHKYHNIERLGFHYDRDRAIEFWSGVSEHTEPFQFFTSPFENTFPHALDIATGGGGPVAMHVVCHSGDIWMHNISVSGGYRELVEA